MTALDIAKSNINEIIFGLFKQEVLLRVSSEAAGHGMVETDDVPYLLSTLETIRKELMIQAEAAQETLLALSAGIQTKHGKAGKGTKSA